MRKLFKIWRAFLPFLFVFVLVHLLKDITQDILRVKSPLDIFGDAKEDLSDLPVVGQKLYLYGLGGLSVLAEMFLLISIPIIRKRSGFSKLEKVAVVATIFLLTFFTTAILLDPSNSNIIK